MLHQPAPPIVRVGVVEPPAGREVDRSMDVLQYIAAFVAIVGAALLASIR